MGSDGEEGQGDDEPGEHDAPGEDEPSDTERATRTTDRPGDGAGRRGRLHGEGRNDRGDDVGVTGEAAVAEVPLDLPQGRGEVPRADRGGLDAVPVAGHLMSPRT